MGHKQKSRSVDVFASAAQVDVTYGESTSPVLFSVSLSLILGASGRSGCGEGVLGPPWPLSSNFFSPSINKYLFILL